MGDAAKLRAPTIAVAICALAAALWSQQAKPPETAPPKFISRADLVLVPVVVTDHSGNHIAGLKKEDFSVRENGKEQKIAVFEEWHAAATRVRRASPQQQEFTNQVTIEQTTPRITVIVIDLLNTPWAAQVYGREGLIKFLSSVSGLTAGDPVAIFSLTFGGLRVIHDFTTDPAVLSAALKKIRGTTGVMENLNRDVEEAINREESEVDPTMQRLFAAQREAEESSAAVHQRVGTQTTLQALEAIALRLGGLPGRKAVIWATGGFPFIIDDPQAMGRMGGTELARDYERAFRALMNGNVAVYPIDVQGLTTVGMPTASSSASARASRTIPNRAIGREMDTHMNLENIAHTTGGKAYFNRNDIDQLFREAVRDSSAYYVVAYYAGTPPEKTEWRRIQVKVNHSGAQVRARQGYYTRPANQPVATDEAEILAAVNSPLEFTALPLTVRWSESKAGKTPGKRLALFELTLPANAIVIDEADRNHMSLSFAAIARTPTGDSAGNVDQNVQAQLKPDTLAQVRGSGITYRNGLELPPGEYAVHFAVRDNLGGKVGTVTAPLRIDSLPH